jgi:hypothetical protein
MMAPVQPSAIDLRQSVDRIRIFERRSIGRETDVLEVPVFVHEIVIVANVLPCLGLVGLSPFSVCPNAGALMSSAQTAARAKSYCAAFLAG